MRGPWDRSRSDDTPRRRGLFRLRGPRNDAPTDEGELSAPGGEADRRSGDILYRQLLEKIPAVTYRAEVGPRGRWTFVSPQIEAMLGYSAEKWTSKPELWIKCVHPEDREDALTAESRAHETGEPLASEYRMVTRDGRTIWVRDEAVVKQGRPAVLEGWLIDITDQKRAEASLEHDAIHDPLTGLLNRRRFDTELEEYVQESAARDTEGALVVLDLDNFKAINDSLGHEVGDLVLQNAARELESKLRRSDLIGRLGGDEFAVLLKGVSEREAWSIGVTLVKGVRTRLSRFKGTVSVGIAILDGRHGDTAEAARVAADRALYQAKELGRDNVCVYHDAPAPSADESSSIA